MGSTWILQADAFDPIGRAREMGIALRDAGIGAVWAILVLLAGWIVATIVGALLAWLLRRMRFNAAVRQLMGAQWVGEHEPAALAGWLAHWGVLALALVLACDVFGFQIGASLSELLRDLVPRILAAVVLFVLGTLVAMALGALARRFFETAGLRGAKIGGQVVSFALTLIAMLLALEQLGFAAQFVMGLGLVVTGAAGLAVGLSFGLGCKELARDFVVEYLRSLDENPESR
jgi:hypothetical protein